MSTKGSEKINMSLDDIIRNDRIQVMATSDHEESQNQNNEQQMHNGSRNHLNGSGNHLDGSGNHLSGSRNHLSGSRSHLNGSRNNLNNFYNGPNHFNRNHENYQGFGRRCKGPPGDRYFRSPRYHYRPNRYYWRPNNHNRFSYRNSQPDLVQNQSWRGRNSDYPLTRQTLDQFNYSFNGNRMRRSGSVVSNHSFHSNRSFRSQHSNHSRISNRSLRSNHSQRSNFSHRSNFSMASNYSNRSHMSNRSGRQGGWHRDDNRHSGLSRNPCDFYIQEEIKYMQSLHRQNRSNSNSPLLLDLIQNFSPIPVQTDITMTERFSSYYF